MIVFDNMIADMINNKKLNSLVTELFIRGRKLNISLVFITQSYFQIPKDVRLNSTHFSIMKIPNKRELQQIVLNHSVDISSKGFIKIHKKCLLNHILFWLIMLASDNPLRFRKNLLIYNKIMTVNNQIRDEKLQFDISRKAAEISALSSGKIDKYEYVTGNEILPSNQQQIIEQTKFTYSPLGKAFEKQIKTIKDQGEKQVEALKGLKPKEQTKPIDNKSHNKNNQSITANIFNNLIKKRKDIMNELNESVDYNKLYFKYVGKTKDVSFYEYMDSMKLFNEIENSRVRLHDALKKQKKLLKKIK